MSKISQSLKNYVKNLYCEYRDVFKEIRQNAVDRPVKAYIYCASTLFICNMFRVNEDLRSYQNEFVSASTKMFGLTENNRNKSSYSYIQKIGQLNVEGSLRQIDLGFLTIIYKSDYNTELGLYRATCPILQPSIYEILTDRMIDIGLLGQWILLTTNMKDYDINEDEWIESEPDSNSSSHSNLLSSDVSR